LFEAFQTVGSWGVTVFVITSMLNVGLTQKPSRLLEHLDNRAFLLRMLVINLVVVPALMIAVTDVVPLEPVYAAGLLLFFLSAGAPFLIKLANISDADIALAATVLLVLMVATVVVLPVALPLVVQGLTVDVTAQRGTAAALIVAQTNFDDPRVLVIITLVNTLGVVLLIAAAKVMNDENDFSVLTPTAVADPPPA
jgi:predicted Na+-dependent transporter